MAEEKILDDEVQQPHTTDETTPKPDATVEDKRVEQPPPSEPQPEDAKPPHPLEPEGDRFKQVWARAKKAEERASQVEAEVRVEREERIRLEERLKAKETATAQQPQFTWDQLQTAVDAGTITMAKAFEIRDQQLYERWQRDQAARDDSHARLASTSMEMAEYKKLVPNATTPGTDERRRVEQEYGYLVQRLGRPSTKEQELSLELAAARAAFGDLDTLRTKQQLTSKPLGREPYMETSSTQKKTNDVKKDFKSTLPAREVAHYERMMRKGRYPGGWGDVQKEYEDYEKYKATQATVV